MRTDGLTVTLPDGTVMPLADAAFQTRWNIDVALDGVVLDLGVAYRVLLTWRQWATAELDRLRTQLADAKAHMDYCSATKAEQG